MEKELFDDLMLSLNQAVEYVKGDKTKARSMMVTIPDEEIEFNQLFFQKLGMLSDSNKHKAMEYVNELLYSVND